jgi:hypothetical protein
MGASQSRQSKNSVFKTYLVCQSIASFEEAFSFAKETYKKFLQPMKSANRSTFTPGVDRVLKLFI